MLGKVHEIFIEAGMRHLFIGLCFSLTLFSSDQFLALPDQKRNHEKKELRDDRDARCIKHCEELTAEVREKKRQEEENKKKFLYMWIGRSGPAYISPFNFSQKVKEDILTYVLSQDKAFQVWYRSNIVAVSSEHFFSSNRDKLEELKNDAILDNGNTFIHELVSRGEIDWLLNFKLVIDPAVIDKAGQTVMDCLVRKKKSWDNDYVQTGHQNRCYLIIDHLIQFLKEKDNFELL